VNRSVSRFYQLKTGHCLTGLYLNWTKNRPTPQCWWCRYRTQTRDHLFKVCPEWKPQQKILWAEVRKETGKGKDRWKVRDLLADGRCSRAVLDFLSTTDVGRWVPGVEEDDAVSAVSELEVREWLEEQGAGAEEQDAGGNYRCSYPRPTSWRRQARSRGDGVRFSFGSFLGHFPWARLPFLGTGLGGGQKGCLQRAATARTADRKRTVHMGFAPRHDLNRSHTSNE